MREAPFPDRRVADVPFDGPDRRDVVNTVDTLVNDCRDEFNRLARTVERRVADVPFDGPDRRIFGADRFEFESSDTLLDQCGGQYTEPMFPGLWKDATVIVALSALVCVGIVLTV